MTSSARRRERGRGKRHDPLALVKDKINRWARWFGDRPENGYPPHSWEGRVILRGGAAPRPQDIAQPLPVDTVAEGVEREIWLMDTHLREALIERHLRRQGDRMGALHLHCSRAGYRERCTRAYWWLKGRLDC